MLQETKMNKATRINAAEQYFFSGYNCAQSVLLSFKDKTGVDEKLLAKAASGFGSGMGNMQETCGAVTSAFMLLGFLTEKPEEKESRINQAEIMQQFTDSFTAAHSSTVCRKLINYDLTTEEGKTGFTESESKRTVCLECIKTSIQTLDQLLSK